MRHPNLESTEKPFYELIGEKYPSSPDQFPLYSSPSLETLDSNKSHNSNNSGIQSFHDNSEFSEYQNYQIPLSQSSLSFVNGNGNDLLFKTLPTIQFEKGIEEAKKFLPSIDKLAVKVGEINLTLLQNPIKQERRQKNLRLDDSGFEETRRINQLAFSYEEPVIPLVMFDDVLLCSCERFPQDVSAIREKVFTEAGKDSKNSIPNESGVSRKSRQKKQLKEEVVDFNIFLLHCTQIVANNNNNLRGYEFLKQIRQHSFPHGHASMRLAHYFANGLEARLAGTERAVLLKQIRMLNAGYVWIDTDWLSSILDSSGSADPATMSLIQGAIVLRPHTPYSNIKQIFLSR
ncbi:scarecrow-like protein 34 [Dendrobium catenatum]|uniref:scarecrow-like protein 34 n=1 Tax=Dendrobium catenatum TaxID=906689 RepID=UPI0009F47D27|nr:scarecrow-like protein 34 [Dendrobium catenatum]